MPRRKNENGHQRGPSGMGTVSRRKDGRWWARITLEDGTRKAFYGQSESEVKAKLVKALDEKQKGALITERVPTLKEFLNRWLEDVAKPRIRASSYLRYSQLFTLHTLPTLGRLKLSKLTPQHLQRLYKENLTKGLAPGHVGQIHRTLHVALKTAVRWGYIHRNPCDLVDPPRVPKGEYQVFTPEQAGCFLRTIENDPLEAYYITALTTGMRAGELRGLRWEDIDFDHSSITVKRSLRRVQGLGWVENEPKTRSSWRTIPLIQPAVNALRNHRVRQTEQRLATGPLWQDKGRVFTNSVGQPLDDGNIARQSLRPLLNKAGLPIMRQHDLRHSCATVLKAFGVDLHTISAILGHSSISITADLYTHVLSDSTREAVERLNTLFKAGK